ncbi:MAG: VCBS repeat-containing protein [Planctomycetes bacterium]|nr:VCBS repeat-containing protein [Planctomycetota bacterium]
MVTLSRSFLLLVAAACLPGCLWITGTVAGVAAGTSGGGDGSRPDLPTLAVSLLSPGEMPQNLEVAGRSSGPEEEGWREGVVPFRVALRGPATSGRHRVRFSYLGSNSVERPFRTRPPMYLGSGATSPAPDDAWDVPPDLPPGGDLRTVLWDTRAEGLRSERVGIVVRWGRAKALSETFFVDNTPIPEIEIPDGFVPESEPRVREDGAYENVVEVPVRVRWTGEAEEPIAGDPATGPVTVEARLRVLERSPGASGVLELPGATLSLPALGPGGAEGAVRWSSELELPDDHARVQLELAPRQLKRGASVLTAPFRVDNRAPRPLVVSPLAVPSDDNFTLTVTGSGLAWPRVGLTRGTRLGLLRSPGEEPVLLDAVAAMPEPPGDGPLPLAGPSSLSFRVPIDDVGLRGHRGALTVRLVNPNGRSAELEGKVFLGPSRLSPVGPFYALEAEPREVVLGDFTRDIDAPDGTAPDGAARRDLDAALIFEDRPVVAVFGGDGRGLFPDRWVVTLSSEEARPLAIEAVHGRDGPRDGLVVATTRTLELIEGGDARGLFAVRQLAEILEEDEARDLALGDFNGDGVQDIAVSSRLHSRVEILAGELGSTGRLSWRRGRFPDLERANSASALAAANFDADPRGLSDLLVLGDSGGVSAVFLHLNQGGSFGSEPAATLKVPEGATSVVSRPGLFFDSDPYPDLVVVKTQGMSKVFLRHEREGVWSFVTFPRPTGPSTDALHSGAIGNLPGGPVRETVAMERPPGPPIAWRDGPSLRIDERLCPSSDEDTWDLAAVDDEFLACAYGVESGLDVGTTAHYRLPGRGVSLDAGDLNGDCFDDFAVATAEPPAFSVHLSRPWAAAPPESDAAPQDLLHMPLGTLLGENAVSFPSTIDFDAGRTAAGQLFLAVANRGSDEVIVLFLEGRPFRAARTERYLGLGRRLRSVAVRDFDGEPGDDIAVSSRNDARITLLHGLREGAGGLSFRAGEKPLLDLLRDEGHRASLPEALKGASATQLRGMSKLRAAQLDGVGPPEIIIPFLFDNPEGEPEHDFVIVLVNPGPGQRIDFYRTLDEPRQVAVANLNGDGALDLVVGCEGRDPEAGNSVHLLFGDPDATASGRLFFDAESKSPSRIAPLQLPGIEADENGEVEVVGTDSLPENGFRKASFIFASNNQVVSVYGLCRGKAPSLPPCGFSWPCEAEPAFVRHAAGDPEGDLFIACPRRLIDGGDPEEMVIADLLGDDGLLDLAVADEDASFLYLFRATGPGDWTLESKIAVPTPAAILDLPPADGGIPLAVLSGAETQVVLFERRGCPALCNYTRASSTDLEEPLESGRPAGFSAAEGGQGLVAASLVEDRDAITRSAAVDLAFFSARLELEAALDIDDPSGPVARARVTGFPSDAVPGAVLLADIAGGDGMPDLVFQDGTAGAIFCLPLSPPGAEGGAWTPVAKGQAPTPLCAAPDGASVVDWETLASPGSIPRILAATSKELFLLTIALPAGGALQASCESLERGPGRDELRDVAHGWLEGSVGAPRSSLQSLFVAVLEDRALRVVLDPLGAAKPLTLLEDPGVLLRAVGAADLNADGLDDLVAADAVQSRLVAFKGQRSSGGLELGFEPAQSFPYLGLLEPVGLAFLDANGDTVLDAALGAREGQVLFFLGLGDGSFRGAQAVYAGRDLEGLAARDLDGDGVGEVLASVGVPGLVVISTGVSR